VTPSLFLRGGVLSLSTGQYEITFEECKNHTYTHEANKYCDLCNAKREVVGEALINEDGTWYYYKDSDMKNTTTLVKYKGKWFYVEDGVWVTRNALVEYKGVTFYIKGGKWDSSLKDTLYKIDGKTYKIKNGKVA
jgi:hypothetical protein